MCGLSWQVFFQDRGGNLDSANSRIPGVRLNHLDGYRIYIHDIVRDHHELIWYLWCYVMARAQYMLR